MSCRVGAVALLLVLGAGGAQPARAESPVELPATGLMLSTDQQIVIEQHDLSIAADHVRASYVLHNSGDNEQRRLIAFALPDLDMANLSDQAVTLPASGPNFTDATVTVDGQRVHPVLEQRALAFGLDVTQRLEEAGLALFPFDASLAPAVARLSSQVRDEFIARGLLRHLDDRLLPAWTLKSSYAFVQTFAANRSTTVVLDYIALAATLSLTRENVEAKRHAVCIGSDLARTLIERASSRQNSAQMVIVTHLLSAGSGLMDSIGRFRLTIERGDRATSISTCRGDIRQTTPAQSEWSARDFVPDDDITVLFVR